jgi:hypothetical protein
MVKYHPIQQYIILFRGNFHRGGCISGRQIFNILDRLRLSAGTVLYIHCPKEYYDLIRSKKSSVDQSFLLENKCEFPDLGSVSLSGCPTSDEKN